MTSSLVGSEMCIRDSLDAIADMQAHIQVQESEEVVLRAQLEGLQTTETVSYTHLTLPTICSV
eukprot:8324629-Prorocentrum_lima.AAC.1